MDPRTVARVHAGGRVALGAALMTAPGVLGRLWVGRDARRPASHVYSGALGVRDLGVGLGVLATVDDARAARPWIAIGMLADAVDILVTVRHRRALPALGVASVGVMASGSVVVGAWLHRSLGRGAGAPQVP